MTVDSNVRIVTLGPSKVACYRALGKSPEVDAFAVVSDWGKNQGLIGKKETRLFGFDNPSPSSGKSFYGYEVWMTVGRDVEASGDIEIKDFPGGRYVAMTTGLPEIGKSWKRLVAWCKESDYSERAAQCLEEPLTPPTETAFKDARIDILLPIED